MSFSESCVPQIRHLSNTSIWLKFSDIFTKNQSRNAFISLHRFITDLHVKNSNQCYHYHNRLVKGDGEIMEEIVTKDRHKDINRQANRGDGEYFQSRMRTNKWLNSLCNELLLPKDETRYDTLLCNYNVVPIIYKSRGLFHFVFIIIIFKLLIWHYFKHDKSIWKYFHHNSTRYIPFVKNRGEK